MARAHEIDAILVTELSRCGRSTQDLVQILDDLHARKVSVLAQTGLSFDLSTSSGKLMRTIMAGLAEFERELITERVKSGLASARARGVKLGRRLGQRPLDKKAKRVLGMHADGLSYRLIARNVGMSKNTVMEIVRRSVLVIGLALVLRDFVQRHLGRGLDRYSCGRYSVGDRGAADPRSCVNGLLPVVGTGRHGGIYAIA